MSNISNFLFPEFENRIPTKVLRKSLELVEILISFSKGKSLGYDDIKKIDKRLDTRIKGRMLYAGGSSVLFAWSFNFGDVGSIILKPYYSRELSALIIHYLTWQDYIKNLKEGQFIIGDKEFKINIPKVVGIAKIEVLSKLYPILITMESLGESIQSYSPLIKSISKIAREFALKGIICDPYPANWKVSFNEGQGLIDYIDLLSSNKLKNLQSRIRTILQYID